MRNSLFLTWLLGVSFSALSIVIFFIVFFMFCRRKQSSTESVNAESPDQGFSSDAEELVTFDGGEDLTICDILDAPGEVIGKPSYGTLYKASLQRSGKIRVLRFLRPVCTVRSDRKEFNGVIERLGFVRHENLVPLLGFYAGNRGEKLMVHPFFSSGNLSDFIRRGDDESTKWINILSITIGISKALDHLHSGMKKPIVHGNLKSKNVLLSSNFKPRISDFGLHLLLNQTAGQEILDVSEAEGYKAPELIKMKEVSKESDVYSLGVIMLELVSGKEATNKNPTGDDEFYLPEYMRNAVLDRKLSDLFRPEILRSGVASFHFKKTGKDKRTRIFTSIAYRFPRELGDFVLERENIAEEECGGSFCLSITLLVSLTLTCSLFLLFSKFSLCFYEFRLKLRTCQNEIFSLLASLLFFPGKSAVLCPNINNTEQSL